MKVLKVLKVLTVLMVLALCGEVAVASPAESERLGRAKDLIADERWTRAIAELRLALADRKEPARDEAAYWLAHSLYQAGEPGEALTVIDALERERPRSLWVKPARSLRIEIAHRLKRTDLLWKVATPPPPPPAPAPVAVGPGAPPPPPAAPPAQPPKRPRPIPPGGAMTTVTPEIAVMWDLDLRIQALSSLMSSEAARVVPILREIALKAEDEAQARRAIYVLAQSSRADARSTIVEVARTGDEPRQVTAVKVLAYQGWPEAEKVLLDVYGAATPHVKRQVIRVFGNVGSRRQLRQLFDTSEDIELKHAIINALFEAGASSELQRIAKQEKNEDIRRAAKSKLDLLAR
jgi:Tetratricopeptide repeat